MCKELYWFQNCSRTKQFVLDMKWFKTENTISLSFSWIGNNAWQKIKLKKNLKNTLSFTLLQSFINTTQS